MNHKRLYLWLGLAAFICALGALSRGDEERQRTNEPTHLKKNKTLVRRWIEEGFNKRNLEVVDELFVEEFVVNGKRIGREGLRQSMNRHLNAFPDLHVTITEILAEGEMVNIWYTVRGTHSAEFEGIGTTGRLVNWYGADLFWVRKDKIIEARFLSDSLGLIRQLGGTLQVFPNHN